MTSKIIKEGTSFKGGVNKAPRSNRPEVSPPSLKPKKNETAYCICHGKTQPLFWTIRSTKKACIEVITENYASSWNELKSDGFYVTKCEVVI